MNISNDNQVVIRPDSINISNTTGSLYITRKTENSFDTLATVRVSNPHSLRTECQMLDVGSGEFRQLSFV